MFEYLNENDRTNLKKEISHWLRLFLIEPVLKTHNINVEDYLTAYDRHKAAHMCYEYLLISGEFQGTLLEVEKGKLVKDIAKYLDLSTPFTYYKIHEKPQFMISKQMLGRFPFRYKINERNALLIINESKKSLLLKNKEKWCSINPSKDQMKTIKNALKKQKKQLSVEVEEINKYQASVLIPYLLDKQIYDEEEIKLLIK